MPLEETVEKLKTLINPSFIDQIPKEDNSWKILLTIETDLKKEALRLCNILVMQELLTNRVKDANDRKSLLESDAYAKVFIESAYKKLDANIRKDLGSMDDVIKDLNKDVKSLATSYLKKNPIVLSEETLKGHLQSLEKTIEQTFYSKISQKDTLWSKLSEPLNDPNKDALRLIKLSIMQELLTNRVKDANDRKSLLESDAYAKVFIESAYKKLDANIRKDLGSMDEVIKDLNKDVKSLTTSYLKKNPIELTEETLKGHLQSLEKTIKQTFYSKIPQKDTIWSKLLEPLNDPNKDALRLIKLSIMQELLTNRVKNANDRKSLLESDAYAKVFIESAYKKLDADIRKDLGGMDDVIKDLNKDVKSLTTSYLKENPIELTEETLKGHLQSLEKTIEQTFYSKIPQKDTMWLQHLEPLNDPNKDALRLIKLLIMQELLTNRVKDANHRKSLFKSDVHAEILIESAYNKLDANITKDLGNKEEIIKTTKTLLPELTQSYLVNSIKTQPKDIVIELLREGKVELRSCAPEIKSDEDAIMAAYKKDPNMLAQADNNAIKPLLLSGTVSLKYCDSTLKDDTNLIEQLAKSQPQQLEFASTSALVYLFENKKIDSQNLLFPLILSQDISLQNLSDEQKSNPEVLDTFARTKPTELKYVSEEVGEKSIIKAIINKHIGLGQCEEPYISNTQVVLAAFKIDPTSLDYVSPKKIIELFSTEKIDLDKCPDSIRQNKDILLESYLQNNMLLPKFPKEITIDLLKEKKVDISKLSPEQLMDNDICTVLYQTNGADSLAYLTDEAISNLISTIPDPNTLFNDIAGFRKNSPLIMASMYNRNPLMLQQLEETQIIDLAGLGKIFLENCSDEQKENPNIIYAFANHNPEQLIHANLEQAIKVAVNLLEEKKISFSRIPKSLRNIPKLAELAYSISPENVEYIPNDLVISLLEQNEINFSDCVDLHNDPKAVIAAYKGNKESLKYASVDGIVKALIAEDPWFRKEFSYKYCNDLQLRDKSIVLGLAYRDDSTPELKNASISTILSAMEYTATNDDYPHTAYDIFRKVSELYKDDEDIIIKAIKLDSNILDLASPAVAERINKLQKTYDTALDFCLGFTKQKILTYLDSNYRTGKITVKEPASKGLAFFAKQFALLNSIKHDVEVTIAQDIPFSSNKKLDHAIATDAISSKAARHSDSRKVIKTAIDELMDGMSHVGKIYQSYGMTDRTIRTLLKEKKASYEEYRAFFVAAGLSTHALDRINQEMIENPILEKKSSVDNEYDAKEDLKVLQNDNGDSSDGEYDDESTEIFTRFEEMLRSPALEECILNESSSPIELLDHLVELNDLAKACMRAYSGYNGATKAHLRAEKRVLQEAVQLFRDPSPSNPLMRKLQPQMSADFLSSYLKRYPDKKDKLYNYLRRSPFADFRHLIKDKQQVKESEQVESQGFETIKTLAHTGAKLIADTAVIVNEELDARHQIIQDLSKGFESIAEEASQHQSQILLQAQTAIEAQNIEQLQLNEFEDIKVLAQAGKKFIDETTLIVSEELDARHQIVQDLSNGFESIAEEARQHQSQVLLQAQAAIGAQNIEQLQLNDFENIKALAQAGKKLIDDTTLIVNEELDARHQIVQDLSNGFESIAEEARQHQSQVLLQAQAAIGAQNIEQLQLNDFENIKALAQAGKKLIDDTTLIVNEELDARHQIVQDLSNGFESIAKEAHKHHSQILQEQTEIEAQGIAQLQLNEFEVIKALAQETKRMADANAMQKLAADETGTRFGVEGEESQLFEKMKAEAQAESKKIADAAAVKKIVDNEITGRSGIEQEKSIEEHSLRAHIENEFYTKDVVVELLKNKMRFKDVPNYLKTDLDVIKTATRKDPNIVKEVKENFGFRRDTLTSNNKSLLDKNIKQTKESHLEYCLIKLGIVALRDDSSNEDLIKEFKNLCKTAGRKRNSITSIFNKYSTETESAKYIIDSIKNNDSLCKKLVPNATSPDDRKRDLKLLMESAFHDKKITEPDFNPKIKR